MNTKDRILEEALSLFSEKGYSNVFVGEIAERVGIKAPSLYKHFKNKQAIFDEIILRMHQKFLEEAKQLNIVGNDAGKDAAIYRSLSEEELVKLGKDLFLYQLHDPYTKRIRKMLTIEQFRDKDLAGAYTDQYFEQPLLYEKTLLGLMVQQGVLKTDNVEVMTLQFYAPFYLYLTVCDRDPGREEEALKILEEHIRQFNRLYRRKHHES